MRIDGIGPDPSALAAGNFAADREGKVLEVILSGATDGTNDAILAHLQANPPEGWRGQIREPTVRCFTKSATEAGIIEARLMGGRTVYVPLEDGPSFARATPEGLAFRHRVLEASTPFDPAKEPSATGGVVSERRARVRELMGRLQAQGLGTMSSTDRRDRFSLSPGLPASLLLTDLPDSPSFIRSEDGSLLFRAPTGTLRERLMAIVPNEGAGSGPRRLEYRWSDLTPAVLDLMFEVISDVARSESAAPFLPKASSILAARIDCEELPKTSRDWTINDLNDRHFHGIVRLAESPLTIRLSWRATPESAVTSLGCFRLDLHRLLIDGYVRREREGEEAPEVRLRFARNDEGIVSIQIRSDLPALPVTWVDRTALQAAGL